MKMIRFEDEELWREFKAKAALRGLRIKEVIAQLIKAWVEGKIKI